MASLIDSLNLRLAKGIELTAQEHDDNMQAISDWVDPPLALDSATNNKVIHNPSGDNAVYFNYENSAENQDGWVDYKDMVVWFGNADVVNNDTSGVFWTNAMYQAEYDDTVERGREIGKWVTNSTDYDVAWAEDFMSLYGIGTSNIYADRYMSAAGEDTLGNPYSNFIRMSIDAMQFNRESISDNPSYDRQITNFITETNATLFGRNSYDDTAGTFWENRVVMTDWDGGNGPEQRFEFSVSARVNPADPFMNNVLQQNPNYNRWSWNMGGYDIATYGNKKWFEANKDEIFLHSEGGLSITTQGRIGLNSNGAAFYEPPNVALANRHFDFRGSNNAGVGFKLKQPNGTVRTVTINNTGNWSIV